MYGFQPTIQLISSINFVVAFEFPVVGHGFKKKTGASLIRLIIGVTNRD